MGSPRGEMSTKGASMKVHTHMFKPWLESPKCKGQAVGRVTAFSPPESTVVFLRWGSHIFAQAVWPLPFLGVPSVPLLKKMSLLQGSGSAW